MEDAAAVALAAVVAELGRRRGCGSVRVVAELGRPAEDSAMSGDAEKDGDRASSRRRVWKRKTTRSILDGTV